MDREKRKAAWEICKRFNITHKEYKKLKRDRFGFTKIEWAKLLEEAKD